MPLPHKLFETVLLEFDRADRVATITLNWPDRLNSFNRTMCEEMQAVRHVKLDRPTNAVVLRAASSPRVQRRSGRQVRLRAARQCGNHGSG